MKAKSKIKILNNTYFQKKQKEAQLDEKRRGQLKRHRIRMKMWLTVVLVITLVFGYRIVKAEYQKHIIEKKIQVTNKKVNKTKQKNKELNEKVAQLKDEKYTEKIIRDKYGYSKDGETVYILPDKEN